VSNPPLFWPPAWSNPPLLWLPAWLPFCAVLPSVPVLPAFSKPVLPLSWPSVPDRGEDSNPPDVEAVWPDCWLDCCPPCCDWLDELEELLDELLALDELLELDEELAVGKLGDPDELEDDVLGMLGEELGMLDDEVLGMLGVLGELGELDGLGMLGMLLDDEELEDVWHPARTAVARPSTKMVRKEPAPFLLVSEPWVTVDRMSNLAFCDVPNVIFNGIAIYSLPPSGWLKGPKLRVRNRIRTNYPPP